MGEKKWSCFPRSPVYMFTHSNCRATVSALACPLLWGVQSFSTTTEEVGCVLIVHILLCLSIRRSMPRSIHAVQPCSILPTSRVMPEGIVAQPCAPIPLVRSVVAMLPPCTLH